MRFIDSVTHEHQLKVFTLEDSKDLICLETQSSAHVHYNANYYLDLKDSISLRDLLTKKIDDYTKNNKSKEEIRAPRKPLLF